MLTVGARTRSARRIGQSLGTIFAASHPPSSLPRSRSFASATPVPSALGSGSSSARRNGHRPASSSSSAIRTASTSTSAWPSSKDSPLPDSPITIFTTVADYREWRRKATQESKSVGFVATMGALHEGHLKLVRASLEENDYTVVSIFVNPAQFAPTEDLASYPRTVPSDIAKLASITHKSDGRKVNIAFVPAVNEMYPNGFTQVVADQVGAFVEVKGLSHQMEGGSRPTFFRGVATVVTKLFHIIQPDRTYFGQKDIQQSVVLRRLVSDLIFSHPSSPEDLRVIPTGRDPKDNLALSSRNAYLTPQGRKVAPVLYRALKRGQDTWSDSKWTPNDAEKRIRTTLSNARQIVLDQIDQLRREGSPVHLRLDYISLNHPKTLENLEDLLEQKGASAINVDDGAILSGAALVSEGKDGKVTRLIDNLLLGFQM